MNRVVCKYDVILVVVGSRRGVDPNNGYRICGENNKINGGDGE